MLNSLVNFDKFMNYIPKNSLFSLTTLTKQKRYEIRYTGICFLSSSKILRLLEHFTNFTYINNKLLVRFVQKYHSNISKMRGLSRLAVLLCSLLIISTIDARLQRLVKLSTDFPIYFVCLSILYICWVLLIRWIIIAE